MPLPKRKYPKARQGKRRSHLQAIPLATEFCPQCHNLKVCHHVCLACGRYSGKEVIKLESAKGKR